MELLTALTSPIYALGISVVGATSARLVSKKQPSIGKLVLRSFAYIGIFLVLSLAYTIYAMWHYEKTTGYSAGNGPLGWIFIYAPLSIACGIIIALLHWLYSDAI